MVQRSKVEGWPGCGLPRPCPQQAGRGVGPKPCSCQAAGKTAGLFRHRTVRRAAPRRCRTRARAVNQREGDKRMITLNFRVSAALSFVLACAAVSPAQDRLVNMVPNSRSAETAQDSEPTITVDPNNSSRMAGSAFTWDNLTGSPMATATAPIYVSTDGGNT